MIDPRIARALLKLMGHATLVVAESSPTAEAVRSPVWSALADRMAPGEVALVHLDVLPGWHLLGGAREMVRHHARRQGLAPDQALDDLAAFVASVEVGPRWGGWLDQIFALSRDPVIRAKLLSDVHPAELHVLCAEADGVGLGWIGDARLPTCSRATLTSVQRAWVDAEARDAVSEQQVLDYQRNQHTHAALFIKGETAPMVLDADALPGLWVGPGRDEPLHWGTEPPRIGAAPAARAVVEQVLDWCPAGDLDPVGVLTALELGWVTVATEPLLPVGGP